MIHSSMMILSAVSLVLTLKLDDYSFFFPSFFSVRVEQLFFTLTFQLINKMKFKILRLPNGEWRAEEQCAVLKTN